MAFAFALALELSVSLGLMMVQYIQSGANTLPMSINPQPPSP
jgi:hypothetical protein